MAALPYEEQLHLIVPQEPVGSFCIMGLRGFPNEDLVYRSGSHSGGDGGMENRRAQPRNSNGAGTMAKFRSARKALRNRTIWRDFVMLSMFVLLFGAALTATVSDGPMHQMKGAWVTQAMR